MLVAVISGSLAGEGCGVGDYSARLVEALCEAGAAAKLLSAPNWRSLAIGRLVKELLHLQPDLVHVQYPSVGYRNRLGPQLLALRISRIPTVVTLHEFSQCHVLRRLASLGFAFRTRALIFTSTEERRAFLRWAPWKHSEAHVIPIASSIPVYHTTTHARNTRRVVYFGLLRPNKGLEDFLSLVRMATLAGSQFEFQIVGAPDPRRLDYYYHLRKTSDNLAVEWTVSASPERVAQELSQAQFAYLPFPNGLSERRSSLLAALANGVIVITTPNHDTPFALQRAVVFADSPEHALAVLRGLAGDTGKREVLAQAAQSYLRAVSWRAIAEQHLYIYHRVQRDN